MIGTAVFGLASLAAAYSPDYPVFIFARAAQGVGAALVCPSALATFLTRYRETRERRRALTVWTLLITATTQAAKELAGYGEVFSYAWAGMTGTAGLIPASVSDQLPQYQP